MNIPFKWETLDDYTCRAAVPGGWLIRSEGECSLFVSFIVDPDHLWSIKAQAEKE